MTYGPEEDQEMFTGRTVYYVCILYLTYQIIPLENVLIKNTVGLRKNETYDKT